MGGLERRERRVIKRGNGRWREEETDEEGRIGGMTAFCIITHIGLTTLNAGDRQIGKYMSCGCITS